MNIHKIKLFKTLQKIIYSNVIVENDKREVILSEREETKMKLMCKLAEMRREGPKKAAQEVEENVEIMVDKLKQEVDELVSLNEKENVEKINAEFFESAENQEPSESSKDVPFSKIKEINENIPEMIEKFQRAINVVQEATKVDKIGGEDTALLYFYKSQ